MTKNEMEAISKFLIENCSENYILMFQDGTSLGIMSPYTKEEMQDVLKDVVESIVNEQIVSYGKERNNKVRKLDC